MQTQKKKIPIRITVVDAAEILKISQRGAREVLKEIKQKNNKPLKTLVTIKEFCRHTGFTFEELDLHYNGYSR